MRCEQARQLFDAYLDGELSPSLATELGAHRLRCADCRRDLALLEVTGHIIAADREPAALNEGFSDRLLACMDARDSGWRRRLRFTAYFGGALVAAVVGLAVLGLFGRPEKGLVAGKRDVRSVPVNGNAESPLLSAQTVTADLEAPPDGQLDPAVLALQDWIDRAQHNLDAKRQSGETLREALDLTILQWIDILERAKDASAPEDHFPGADARDNQAGDDHDPVDRDDLSTP